MSSVISSNPFVPLNDSLNACNLVYGSLNSSLLYPFSTVSSITGYNIVAGSLSLGLNICQSTCQDTVIGAPYVNVSNGLTIGSVSVSPTSFYAPTASITTLNSQMLICNAASISSLTTSLSSLSGSFLNFQWIAANTLTALSANVSTVSSLLVTGSLLNASLINSSSISGSMLNTSMGSINTLSGSYLNYSSGAMNNLTAGNMNCINGTISVLTGSNVNYIIGSVSSLMGSLGSFATINCNSGIIATMTSVNGSISSLSSANIAAQSLTGITSIMSTSQIGTLTCATATITTQISSQITTSTLTSNVCKLPNSTFTGLHSDLSNLPILSIYNGSSLSSNVKLWTGLGSTTGGTVLFFPTANGTNTGTPIFNSVLYADASCWVNTTNANSICNIAGKVIGLNNGSITFNVTMGSNVAGGLGGGGAATTFAPNNTPVMALMIGV